MKKPPSTEKEVKQLILEYLAKVGVEAWNNPRGMGQLKHGGFIKYGGKPGASDILGFLPNGRFLAIETKEASGKNKASEEQLNFIRTVRANKGVGLVAKNLDEVISALREEMK
jgi:hypothetical protein